MSSILVSGAATANAGCKPTRAQKRRVKAERQRQRAILAARNVSSATQDVADRNLLICSTILMVNSCSAANEDDAREEVEESIGHKEVISQAFEWEASEWEVVERSCCVAEDVETWELVD